MRKKVYQVFIFFMLLLGVVIYSKSAVYAAENIEPVDFAMTIEPRNTNIKYSTISLSLSDGIAKCSASVTGYASNTEHVSIYLYLQKYSGGGWSTVESWSDSADGNTLSMYKTASISSGRYRLKASYYAQTENVVKYSGEKVY